MSPTPILSAVDQDADTITRCPVVPAKKDTIANRFKRLMSKLLTLSVALMGFYLSTAARATTYYVDATIGNDANPGTSLTAPWKTVAKVSNTRLNTGDKILFQASQVHSGNLSFTGPDSGTQTNPVIVSSYGDGRATIYAATGDGIKLSSTTSITVTNINVTGPGWNATNDGSRGIALTGSTNGCIVDNLTVSGFHKAGVRLESNTHHNQVTFVRAEQNGFIGIHISGDYQLVSGCKAFNNNGDLTITNNWSGSGIVADYASYVTIEDSEAAYNGANQPWTGNGPVGIWCWNADHVTIRRCISHHNLRGRGNADGGGFDMDGGTTDSTIEYCYSYGNAGAGFLLYNFNWKSIPHRNNTVRYCISENDKLGGIAIGTGGLPLENLSIHNNVSFNTNGAIVLRNYGGSVNNVGLRNNVLVSSGTLTIGNNAFILQGNCYYSTVGAYSFGSYANNFAAWANATGKEKYNGVIVGLNMDPGLIDVGNGTKLTEPQDLGTLRSYSPASGYSAVVDSGLDLSSLFALDPGDQDIAGQSVPNRSYDMGAFEYQGGTQQDLVSPSVFISSPMDGATVAGASVTVSANAADDVGGTGIAGVQFKLDGVNLGTEDTTSPYSISWNTTSVSNGSHSLTAVARDSAGNIATANPVNVSVYNETGTEIWTSSDIGAVAAAGSSSYDAATGTFTVIGSGADIWGSADEFHYATRSVPLAGDGTITARVVSLTNTHAWAKVGIMLRETATANSKHADVFVTPGNGISMNQRSSNGANTSLVAMTSGLQAPYWLRLTRAGNTFIGYHSPNGITWTQFGSVQLAMAADLEVGLCVTSHTDGVLCTALFDNVIVTSP